MMVVAVLLYLVVLIGLAFFGGHFLGRVDERQAQAKRHDRGTA